MVGFPSLSLIPLKFNKEDVFPNLRKSTPRMKPLSHPGKKRTLKVSSSVGWNVLEYLMRRSQGEDIIKVTCQKSVKKWSTTLSLEMESF